MFILKWLSLIGREFRIFATNSTLLVIFLLTPAIYGIMFGFVYKKGKVTDLPIVVADLDRSPTSDKLIDMLNDNETIEIKHLQYDDLHLRDALLNSEADAVVIIPENFEADLLQRRYPEINVNLSLANILTANFSSKAIQTVLGTMAAGIEIEGLKKQGVAASHAARLYEPFKVNYNRYNNPASNYMYYLLPGILATVLQQVLLLALALSFAMEFENKTFATEFYPKARNPIAAVFTKLIPYWILSIIPLIIYKWVFDYFRLPLLVNMSDFLQFTALFIVAVTSLGILVSILIPSQLKATQVLMLIASPSFIISGFSWPQSQMSDGVVAIANSIPLTHYLEGFRKMYMYQATWSDLQPQIDMLLQMSALFLTLSVVSVYIKAKLSMRKLAIAAPAPIAEEDNSTINTNKPIETEEN